MTARFPLAVHALVYLYHAGQETDSLVLAENICTNPARVRKVMALLCKAGLVVSRRGKGSGYTCRTGDIPLSAIFAALEEKPVTMDWHSGQQDCDCLVSTGMGAAMDGVYDAMNGQCLAYLNTVTVADIEAKLFGRNREAAHGC